MEHNETQNSLSLGDLWSIFANHYLVIIAAAVLVFAAVTSYSVITYKPEYTSSATIYILRQDNEGGGRQLKRGFQLSAEHSQRHTMLTSHRCSTG